MAGQTGPKHREIYRQIHEGILTGTYSAGQRIPTEMELAKAFNTSRVTVARALHDLETQGYLIRRRRAGSFVRMREKETSGLLGLVSGNSPGPLAKISDAMVSESHAKGLSLLSSKWPEAGGDAAVAYAEELCNSHAARKIAGVFWLPSALPDEQGFSNERIAETFSRHGMPVVLLDRDICDSPHRSKFDLIGIDNFHAGYVLTEHLWSLERRRIAFVTDLQAVSTESVRIAGYRFALNSRGVNPSADWIRRGETSDLDFVRGLLDAVRPDGVVCVNDRVAAQLIRTLSTLGVQVPEHVGIVSIDDDQWATYLSTPLTTLRQPFPELGAAAIKMMLERLADPGMPAREMCLACHLIVRESCGGAKKLGAMPSDSAVSMGLRSLTGE